MKKLITISALVVAVTLSSCKKDRTCICTDEDGDQTSITYFKVKKGDAGDKCVSTQRSTYNAKSGVTVIHPKTNCELK